MGSIAAAGLTTGAYAADPAALTSLDVCDAMGKSGLTVSSDTNCLEITGSVSYEFNWGDYKAPTTLFSTGDGPVTVDGDGAGATADDTQDWTSDVEAWIKFVATADSDFGPAQAVIKIKSRSKLDVTDEGDATLNGDDTGFNTDPAGTPIPHSGLVIFDEAYVSVGDSTVLSAGKRGSLINKGGDEPFNFLALFNSEEVDKGVEWSPAVAVTDGGHQIRIESDLGNGLKLGGSLENLNTDGIAVGVLSYSGDTFEGHATIIATDVLDAAVTNWAYHLAGTATLDTFKVRGALAGDDTGYWNGLASAEATFDMFKIAASVEGVHTAAAVNQMGFGLSAGADVSDTVTVNGGFRWFDPDTATASDDGWQAALQLIAAVTETVTITGEIGVYGTAAAATCPSCSVTYGKAELAWAPGGGFTTSVGAQMNSDGAYKLTYKAAKAFE